MKARAYWSLFASIAIAGCGSHSGLSQSRDGSPDVVGTFVPADAGDADAVGPVETGTDVGLPYGPAIIAMGVAETSMRVDLASKLDNGVAQDGASDGAFQLTVIGPLSALILVTTDASGTTCCGQQWDTVVGGALFPPELQSPATQGSGTWALVVYEKGMLLNNSNGSLQSIASGTHNLNIYVSNSNYFNEGQYFRAYGMGSAGEWVEGPVVAYHRGGTPDAGATLSQADAGAVDTVATIISMGVAETSLHVDLTGKLDNGVAPDGVLDGAFQMTVTGPLSALILVTTDASGTTCCGQQWDTIVGAGQFPPELVSPATQGSGTWALVVYENGVLLNSSTGSLQTIASGTHNLNIYASNSNYFSAGQHFRVWGLGASGEWVQGPTIVY